MSRKLGALLLALGILTCSMYLKTIVTGGSGTTVMMAGNGPEPVPLPQPPPKQQQQK